MFTREDTAQHTSPYSLSLFHVSVVAPRELGRRHLGEADMVGERRGGHASVALVEHLQRRLRRT